MSLEWNRFIRKNHWLNHDSDKIFYLKTASHLREYNNALLIRENSQKTMAQSVQTADGTTTNQGAAEAYRVQLRGGSEEMPPAASVLLARSAPTAVQVPGEAIRPPASTQQAHRNAFIGRTPTDLHSSTPTAPKLRCGRCGNYKGGSDHKHGTAINSLD
jgi:hypothetical protein